MNRLLARLLAELGSASNFIDDLGNALHNPWAGYRVANLALTAVCVKANTTSAPTR
jgi:hypothetical protein